MSTIKRKKADESLVVKEFDGLRDDTESAQSGAVKIRNFLFSSERTLEKRPGYREKLELSQNIRTFWHSTVLSLPGDFALIGSQILYCPENESPVSFGNVGNAQGEAKFFVYRDYLYLATSCSLYVCDLQERRFSEAYGYAPVFGEDWNPSTGTGDVKEPLNLFSSRIRVRYFCPIGTQTVYLPFPGESVESVTSNDVAIPFTHTAGARFITLTSAVSSVMRIEVAYTMTSVWSPLRESIASCTIPYSFRKDDKEYLYLAGGDVGFRVYSSAQLNSTQLAESRARFHDSDPLYFKSTGVLYLGDMTHPITAFARQNNRVIAFGSSGAWSIWRGDEGDTVEAYPLESCPGCVSREGALSVGDELLVLSAAGLCALRATTADKDRFSVELLSGKISKILGNFDWAHALILYDPIKDLVLIRDPSETSEGLVYLYNRSLKCWTCWNDIKASLLLASPDGKIVFCYEKKVYVFEDALCTDRGRPYGCVYESGALSFDSPEMWKRTLRVFAEVSGDDDEMFELKIYSEQNENRGCWYCIQDVFPEHFECKLAGGRFRNFFYRITTYGEGKVKIHRLGCYGTH